MSFLFAFLLLFAFPVAMICGGLILVFGSSRTSRKHQCLNCQYDLRGLPTAVRCPECGATLDGSNTIVPGQNITSPTRLTIGLVLSLFGALGLTAGLVAMIAVWSLRQ